ncbi:hypothetical protein DPMN_147154 [Dreissena polymorpha]|uniref:Uncharacterized protein n=1 Tax=Dreissena polymorpha TaxID=45954 RepID=A0A9D4J2Q5_DREPO|nr:hypothetical protein DPMN_147154 [Dreissena polymorpha]
MKLREDIMSTATANRGQLGHLIADKLITRPVEVRAAIYGKMKTLKRAIRRKNRGGAPVEPAGSVGIPHPIPPHRCQMGTMDLPMHGCWSSRATPVCDCWGGQRLGYVMKLIQRHRNSSFNCSAFACHEVMVTSPQPTPSSQASSKSCTREHSRRCSTPAFRKSSDQTSEWLYVTTR